MSKLKKVCKDCGQGAPFILSNTITFIPYFLFLSLNDGGTLEKVLPFVLYYTFRMTGIFLLRSFKVVLASFNVLIMAILFGGMGCFIGILGHFYFPAYLISAIFIGICAAWLPATNTTVNYHEKQQGFTVLTGKKYFFILILLAMVVLSLLLPINARIPLVLGEYLLFFIAAYYTVKQYPGYELDLKEVNQQLVSRKEFVLFVVFFVLLLFTRSARLLLNTHLLDIALIGFSGIFILATWSLNRQRKNWQLPIWLNLLTFINGMCMNFLLLFGAFYVSVHMGSDQLMVNLYLPYLLGILAGSVIIKKFYHLFPTLDRRIIHISSFLIALGVLLFTFIFPVGIFLLSCSINANGTFLNKTYYNNNLLPKDQRIITKYSTQTKGSITHQLLMMSLLWLLKKEYHLPVKTVLKITGHRKLNTAALNLVENVHLISVCGLMFFFLFILYIVVKEIKSKNKTE